MLFAVLMNVCLQADGERCREERIEFTGPAMACLVQVQSVLVEWGQDHPGWLVKSWKCGPA
ncbi:hypothetical protein ACIKTA_14410 [Hansschlegelia beijingensis]|uniref:hypothetical protein n=1 Tax=Hansschlegelia beijingensis TaxID=1133344 RepID=UPI0038133F31